LCKIEFRRIYLLNTNAENETKTGQRKSTNENQQRRSDQTILKECQKIAVVEPDAPVKRRGGVYEKTGLQNHSRQPERINNFGRGGRVKSFGVIDYKAAEAGLLVGMNRC
jgi:hypothetical protein